MVEKTMGEMSQESDIDEAIASLDDPATQAHIAAERENRLQNTIMRGRSIYPSGSDARELFEEALTQVGEDAKRKSSFITTWLKRITNEEAKKKSADDKEIQAQRLKAGESGSYITELIDGGELVNDEAIGLKVLQAHQESILLGTIDDKHARVYIVDDVGVWSTATDTFGLWVREAAKAYLHDVPKHTTTDDIVGLIRKVAKALRSYYTPGGVARVRQGMYMTYLAFENDIVKGIRPRNSEHGITICTEDEVNANDRYMGVANGVVDKWVPRLLDDVNEAKRALVTQKSPYAFKPELGTIEPLHPDVVKVIAHLSEANRRGIVQMVGASVLSGPKKEFVYILGETDSGKSTLTGMFSNCLGTSYSGPVDESIFMQSPGGSSHSSNAKPLLSYLIGHINDPDWRKFSTEKVKRLVDGDVQTVREIFEKQTTGKTTATLWVTSNRMPPANFADEAFVNRMLLCHYTRPPVIDRGGPGLARLSERVLGQEQAESALALSLHAAAWVHKHGKPDAQLFKDDAEDAAREEVGGLLDWAQRNIEKTTRILPSRPTSPGWEDKMSSSDAYDDAVEFATQNSYMVEVKRGSDSKMLPFGREQAGITRFLKERFGLPAGKIIQKSPVSKGWRGIRLSSDEDRADWDSEQAARADVESTKEVEAIPMPFIDGIGMPDDDIPPTSAPVAHTSKKSNVESNDTTQEEMTCKACGGTFPIAQMWVGVSECKPCVERETAPKGVNNG